MTSIKLVEKIHIIQPPNFERALKKVKVGLIVKKFEQNKLKNLGLENRQKN